MQICSCIRLSRLGISSTTHVNADELRTLIFLQDALPDAMSELDIQGSCSTSEPLGLIDLCY
jgi:hypothetical protein